MSATDTTTTTPASSSTTHPPTVGGGTQLHTKTGDINIAPARLQYTTIDAPAGSRTDVLQPLLDAAALLMHIIPKTSEAKIAGAIGRYTRALTFWGLKGPSEEASLAYVIARCCPPVGVPVPPDCESPVAPPTAANDIDALARACEMAVEGMGPEMSDAFKGPRIRALLRAIGARMKRIQTAKRALLYREVETAWDKAERDGSPTAIRDAFALVVAFFFGMRISELLALRPEDVEAVPIGDGTHAMRITFKQCKNRRSILVQHQPFRVANGHPLLQRAWAVFEQRTEYYDDTPMFHRMTGKTRDGLSRAWFSEVIKAAAPGTSPHSARVGLATELWASGASIDMIMAAGRWTSATAVMYVIGALDDTVKATRAIGTGLAYSGDDLRRLGTSPERFDRPHHRPMLQVNAWAKVAASIEA